MRLTTALMIKSLAAIFVVSGCTTTEYIEVTPECSPPPVPTLPQIDKGNLWDQVGDEDYRKIEAYINGLWAYSDEQAAMLNELCQGADDAHTD
ncbi:hypothetical protein [Aidingimonas halophila]|uniref:Uncharacterized protein n=1 Tax=Aidingimonas halophila TaxID=574349 RepID=A0A1H2REI8_9GAMM|nr:hypothetical protein [Aidingimonas halophila]GHC19372.1 hypothetical protein GCM10008094_06720 [Aidingimonas halophila]SDW17817.1 hypothetical protein SAMN05443545_101301 [Aidingimonas halophila]